MWWTHRSRLPRIPSRIIQRTPRWLSLEPLEARTVPSFLPPVNYATGAAPLSVVVGDFNGDGVPDLVTPNHNDDTVSVLLGVGDGTFQDALHSAIIRPFSVAVGDFNRDGIQDLAVGTVGEYPLFEDSSVSILLGNGDGTFQDAYRVLPGGMPVAGDLNGDGLLDIVATLVDPFGSGAIDVLLGNGDGTFQVSRHDVRGVFANAVLADLNNDGTLDLLGRSPGHLEVNILLGHGDGTFQSLRRVTAGPVVPNGVALTDLNLDGNLDLVTSNQYSSSQTNHRSSVSVLLGNGDGSFRRPVVYPTALPVLAQSQMAVAGDFNADGLPDIAVVVSQVQPGSRTVVSVLLGNGDGSLQGPLTTDVERGAQPLAAVDLNGDGLDDVATANFFFFQSSVSVLLNDADWAGTAPGGGLPSFFFDSARASTPPGTMGTTSARGETGAVPPSGPSRNDPGEAALPPKRQPISDRGLLLLSLDEEIHHVPYSLA